MNQQAWLWLFLILFTLHPSGTVGAQHPKPRMMGVQHPKQSHHELQGFDPANAEEMMTQRLQKLRQLSEQLDELHRLQNQMQGMLKNPDFLKHLKQQFTESDLRQIQEKMRKGEDLSQYKDWNRILQAAVTWRQLEPRQSEIIRRVIEQAKQQNKLPSIPPILSGPAPPSPLAIPDLPSPPGGDKPEPSPIDRIQKRSAEWLIENLDAVDGSVLDAFARMDGEAGRSFMVEVLRSIRQNDFADVDFSENALFPSIRAGRLADSLADVGGFFRRQSGILDGMRSFFRDASMPSLPHLDGPAVSMPSSSEIHRAGWAPALLCLLMLGIILAFLCKHGLGSKPLGSGSDGEWRIGPWPVSPGGVSTRHDLVRGFEHLVLLCFGPDAAVCHHRVLAERLAEMDGGRPCRRQAAEMLAWLYEQARYAPAEEALSPEQLSDARHALCLLAGVTAP